MPWEVPLAVDANGLTQVPAHFQFMVEMVLKGKPGDCNLPVVVYLDDIAVFGDD